MMNKKLDVLILSPQALENGRGGEISSMELASGLNKFYNVTFIDTNIFTGKKLLTRREINSKLKGVKKIRRLKFATLNILNRNFSFPYPWEILKLYRIIKNQDIFYTSYSNFKTNLMVIFFKLLLRNVKFIIGYRKPLHSEKLISLYNLKYRTSILFLSLFKKRIYHHTLSEYSKKYLENFYDSNKIFHIIHGIDLDKFPDNGVEYKQRKTLNFIYVGYLDDVHKGLTILLDAIEQLMQESENMKVFFEFYGIGPLESKLRVLEKKYPHHIKFYGYISNKELYKFYKKNDVFLFPSRREPFGRVLIEALVSKLIIVCSKTIGSIEILKGKRFGFFIQEHSSRAFKEKILEIYNLWIKNPDLIKILQSEAIEYALNNFSFLRELEMFRDLVEKIIID